MSDSSLREARVPLWLKQLVWHLNGTAGRSIGWRIKLLDLRYRVGVRVAKRVCRGNKHGDHTTDYFEPLGGRCFCDRTRGRLDYIPF